MQFVNIVNHSRPLLRPLCAGWCVSFFDRLRGLTFSPPLPDGRGLVLAQVGDNRLDAAIHMLGVSYDLGVVWINQAGEVVDLRLARAWRSVIVPARPACYVLEALPGRLDEFQLGDRIGFEKAALA
jgi:uncharacterized membrane protein (UPF0127 family)